MRRPDLSRGGSRRPGLLRGTSRPGGGPLRVGGAIAVGVAGLGLAGCGGGPSADLFLVTRAGTIPGAQLTLRVTSDGRVSCNRKALVRITSRDLIDAREAKRQLEGDKPEDVGPADRRLSLPAGPGSILRYEVRAEAGTVRWADTSPRQPPVFRALAALTRGIAKGSCRLER